MARVDPGLVTEMRAFSSATLHEAAGQIGALPAGLKPLSPAFRLAGPAFTVQSPAKNNLWIHRAIAAAAPGDVLVVAITAAAGEREAGYWGEIMTVGAMSRGLLGLVIDGTVRDGKEIETLAFPVFARGLCIQGTGKDLEAPGALEAPVTIGEVLIEPGDWIVGDGDGVVAIPRNHLRETLDRAKEREAKEAEVMDRLREGETTLDIYGWRF